MANNDNLPELDAALRDAVEERQKRINQCGCGPSTMPWAHEAQCPRGAPRDHGGLTMWDHTRAVIEWIRGERKLSDEQALQHLDRAEALGSEMFGRMGSR